MSETTQHRSSQSCGVCRDSQTFGDQIPTGCKVGREIWKQDAADVVWLRVSVPSRRTNQHQQFKVFEKTIHEWVGLGDAEGLVAAKSNMLN